jgi:hypothetical protein
LIARLPISWKEGAPFEAVPRAFYIADIGRADKSELSVLIRSAKGDSFNVRSLKLDGEECTYRVQAAGSDHKSQIVRFIVRVGDKLGIQRHTVAVDLGDGTGDLLLIPITFIVR